MVEYDWMEYNIGKDNSQWDYDTTEDLGLIAAVFANDIGKIKEALDNEVSFGDISVIVRDTKGETYEAPLPVIAVLNDSVEAIDLLAKQYEEYKENPNGINGYDRNGKLWMTSPCDFRGEPSCNPYGHPLWTALHPEKYGKEFNEELAKHCVKFGTESIELNENTFQSTVYSFLSECIKEYDFKKVKFLVDNGARLDGFWQNEDEVGDSGEDYDINNDLKQAATRAQGKQLESVFEMVKYIDMARCGSKTPNMQAVTEILGKDNYARLMQSRINQARGGR